MTKSVSAFLSLTLLACHVEPPAMPREDSERRSRAKATGRQALAQKAELTSALAEAQQQHAIVAESAHTVETEHQTEVTRTQIAAREVQTYSQALTDADAIAVDCDVVSERLVAVYHNLAKYAPEPRRDAVIQKLESCRKQAVQTLTKIYRELRPNLRQEYAVGVEDRFDENNPYSGSKLVATVKGETLQLRMRGNFEGRARHSQEQVDALCEETELFTSIVLRNSHGTFSCRPSTTPKQSTEGLLEEAGVLTPWVPPVAGDLPTPQHLTPPPPPPPGPSPLQQELASAQTRLQQIESEVATLDDVASKSRSAIRGIDGRQAERETEWRDNVQESAKKVTGVGVGFIVAGSIATGLGIYSAYLRSGSQESVDAMRLVGQPSSAALDKVTAQTNGMIAGLAIGLPLLGIGAILVLTGKRRKDAAQPRVSMTPTGFALRF